MKGEIKRKERFELEVTKEEDIQGPDINTTCMYSNAMMTSV